MQLTTNIEDKILRIRHSLTRRQTQALIDSKTIRHCPDTPKNVQIHQRVQQNPDLEPANGLPFAYKASVMTWIDGQTLALSARRLWRQSRYLEEARAYDDDTGAQK